MILCNLIRDVLKNVTRIGERAKYLIKYLIQSADAGIKLVIEMKSSLHSFTHAAGLPEVTAMQVGSSFLQTAASQWKIFTIINVVCQINLLIAKN